jgi:predicted Na+-dependent transporter
MLEIIKQWTGAFLLSSIALGFIFPQLAVLKPILAPSLMLLLYCSFVKLDFHVNKFLKAQLLLYPLLCWLILPPIVYYSTGFLSEELQVGLLLVIITPPALGAPVITSLAHGNLEFIVSNVTIFNLLAPLAYTFIPKLYLSNVSMEIDYSSIFMKVTTFIFTPLLLAILTRKSKKLTKLVLTKIDPLKAFIQMVLIAVAVSTTTMRIRSLDKTNLIYLLVITFLLSGLLYLIGILMAKKDKTMIATLPMAVGHKNTLLALTIGLASFSELSALPAVFYLIAHHTYNGLIISYSRKYNSPKRNSI